MKHTHAFLLLLAATLVRHSVAHALDITEMVPRSPHPHGAHIIEVTHLNGRWILGAENGLLSHSADGEVWSTVAMPYPKGIRSVTYWDGRYFASGVDGRTLMTSADLVTWTLLSPQNFPFNAQQLFPAYGKLFAVGDSPDLAVSADGVTWTPVSLPVAEGRFEGMATNGSRAVLVGTMSDPDDTDGDGDTQEGVILSSEDGETWTVRTNAIPGLSGLNDDFLSVTHVGGRFVAGGKQGLVFSSPDGLSWTRSVTTFDSWIFRATHLDGHFLLPGRPGKIHRSANLVDWTDMETGMNDSWQGIAVAGSKAVAAGRSGYVAHSGNGTEWTLVTGGSREFFLELAHGADAFVAADAGGGLWRSVDSETWTRVHVVTGQSMLVGLEWDGARFVGLSSSGRLLTSADGEIWAESAAVPGGLDGFARVNGVWWAMGNAGRLVRSDNLADWTELTVGTETPQAIAHGAGVFVVVGPNGAIHSSPDGSVWTPRGLPSVTTSLNAVAFSGGKFVVLGASYTLLTSPDGIAWSSVGGTEIFPYPPANANRLVVIDEEFVALGTSGRVWTSPNGTAWSEANARTVSVLFDIEQTEDRLVAVGSGGTILSSPAAVPSGYGQWVKDKFTLVQQGQSNVTGPGDDPDLDGRPNALEYLAGTSPTVADTDPRFRPVIVTVGANAHPAVQFTRKTGLTDATAVLRRANVLGAWTALGDDEVFEVSADSLDTETELVTLRTIAPLAPGGNVFLQPGVIVTE